MTTAKESAIQVLRMIGDAVVDSVRAGGPLGVPGGTLYATLMTYGCTLSQYEQIMGALVSAGRLEKRGELYFAK